MHQRLRTAFTASTLTLAFVAVGPALARPGPAPAKITLSETEVKAAQQAWGEGLVRISTTNDTQGPAQARVVAAETLDKLYDFSSGPVLFKPTLTEVPQVFRTTREGALSYFVGGNPAFPSDTGFALKGWRKVAFEDAGIRIDGNIATTLGNVVLTDKDGKVTTVDKTWVFKKDEQGRVRIIVHHSSLPYSSQ